MLSVYPSETVQAPGKSEARILEHERYLKLKIPGIFHSDLQSNISGTSNSLRRIVFRALELLRMPERGNCCLTRTISFHSELPGPPSMVI